MNKKIAALLLCSAVSAGQATAQSASPAIDPQELYAGAPIGAAGTEVDFSALPESESAAIPPADSPELVTSAFESVLPHIPIPPGFCEPIHYDPCTLPHWVPPWGPHGPFQGPDCKPKWDCPNPCLPPPCIPEPSGAALLLGAAACLTVKRRR